MTPNGKIIITILMLCASNIFMTFAWYGHLKSFRSSALYVAILVSWGIAFFEYSLQVPANRIGNDVLRVEQLKILQEIITLSIFIPFSIFFLKEKISWNYLAAAGCMVLAAWFVFRK